jgi:Kef-type K+ transport system membrane component KefB
MSTKHAHREESDGTLGTTFWLALIGVTLAVTIGVMIAFLLFSAAWYAWGFLGAVVVLLAVTGVVKYVMDRRARARWS